jgi:cytochrome c-type biogenesis protein
MSGITVPLALAAGVVSFASPCFLPIVPVYVGYLAGSGAGTPPVASGPAAGSASLVPGSGAASTRVLTRARRATVTQACAFVAGFSVVFVALWASIGLVGYAAGDYRDPLRVLGGAVLVVMGLHVAGLIDIPVLSRTMRPVQAPVHAPASTRRSMLLGVAFGAGWSPCIGPILGGVIGLASVSATVGEGAALLAAYCLGLGIPFVLVALGADELHRRMHLFARHEMAVGLISGALLVTAGFLMITDLFGRLSGALPPIGL